MKKYTKGLITLTILFVLSCIIPPGDNINDDNNNDGNGGDGQGTTGSAEIDILGSGGSINIGGSYDFGSLEHGATLTETFTINNYGDETLNLTGNPAVNIAGDSPDFFTINQPAISSISPGGSTSFTVTYEPTGNPSVHTAVISVENNDPDEGAYDIVLNGNGTLTPSALNVTVQHNGVENVVANGASDAIITVTVVNEYDQQVTNYNRTIDITISDYFTISPTTITVNTDGTASGAFLINKDSHYWDEDILLTFNDGDLAAVEKTVQITAALVGQGLDDSAFASGYNLIAGEYHLPARSLAYPSVSVGGDINIGAGTRLAIYPGVTLSMNPGTKIVVEGELIVYGTPDQRVKISGGTSWSGIESGHSTGDAKIFIRGATIGNTSNRPIRVGTGSAARGGNLTVKDSRIRVDGGTTEAIWIYYPKGGATYLIKNSVIISEDEEAIRFDNTESGITGNIVNNTFIGKPSSSPSIAITIADSNSSVYKIKRNIFGGSYSNIIWQSTSNSYIEYDYNVSNSSSAYLNMNGTYVATYNLYIDSSTTDTLSISWDDADVFTNPTLEDYTLKQAFEFPNSAQILYIADKTDVVGSLSNGHGNEKGAYAIGGYPPNYNE